MKMSTIMGLSMRYISYKWTHHKKQRKTPGIAMHNCNTRKSCVRYAMPEIIMYETGNGNKLYMPAMVRHLPSTNSMANMRPAYVTDTDTKPSSPRIANSTPNDIGAYSKNPVRRRNKKSISHRMHGPWRCGDVTANLPKIVWKITDQNSMVRRPNLSDKYPLIMPPVATPTKKNISATLFKYSLSQTNLYCDVHVLPKLSNSSNSHSVHFTLPVVLYLYLANASFHQSKFFKINSMNSK